jgi:glycosyltransferase involved in cell wall biosynthesis
MQTREPEAVVESATWSTARPKVSVVVATHNRADFLPDLVTALEAQHGVVGYEIVIADDGSRDGTWQTLENLVTNTLLPMNACRLPGCGGPSIPRNTAVAHCRGEILAFTDDDCLPAPGWLAALTPAAMAGHVVQGATLPAAHTHASTWDRTITITEPSGLWESCNLGLPRSLFEAVGGFPVLDLLPAGGRGYGEDAVLGAMAARQSGWRWAPDAVVEHRWIPGDYASHLEAMRRLEALPQLAARIPEVREQCFARYFRSRRSAALDLALMGLGTSVVTRRLAPTVAGALPWLYLLVGGAQRRWGGPLPKRVAQEAVADLVGLGALARGSVKARTPLL